MKKIILMVILTGAIFSQNAEAQLQTMIDELDSIAIDMDSLIDAKGLKHHPDTKELYSGKVIKFYEGNKKKIFEGNYKDGEKDGLFEQYSIRDGELYFSINWKDGKEISRKYY